MAAPTLLDYAESTWSGISSGSEVTDDLDWAASGDRVIVLGATEDNTVTLNSPTATGLTFASLSGLPTNTGSSPKVYGWGAAAGGNGNSAVTATISGGSAARGISAWAFSGSDDLGTPVVNVGSGLTVSVTTSADSSIVMVLADWNATTDVTVTTVPVGGTIREATNVSGLATFLIIEWHNQPAGTRNYGVSSWSGTGTVSKAAVEVQGSVGGPINVDLLRVSETDIATVLDKTKVKTLGIAVDTSASRSLTKIKSKTLGIVAQLNSGLSLTRTKTSTLGLNVETSIARLVTETKSRGINRATEVDSAFTVTPQFPFTGVLGRATEIDVSQILAKVKTRPILQATEADISTILAEAKAQVLGVATELDTSRSLGATKVKGLLQVTETGLSQAMTKTKLRTIGAASEVNIANVIALLGMVRRAVEVNIALAIEPSGGEPPMPDVIIRGPFVETILIRGNAVRVIARPTPPIVVARPAIAIVVVGI